MKTVFRALVRSGAPIDRFAVGTAMTTSADAPSWTAPTNCRAGRPACNVPEGRPGPAKQVYRRLGQDGRLDGDTITVEGTTEPGRPLLHQVMRAGSRVAPDPSMDTIRQRAGLALAELPDTLRRLDQTASYEVRIARSPHGIGPAGRPAHVNRYT